MRWSGFTDAELDEFRRFRQISFDIRRTVDDDYNRRDRPRRHPLDDGPLSRCRRGELLPPPLRALRRPHDAAEPVGHHTVLAHRPSTVGRRCGDPRRVADLSRLPGQHVDVVLPHAGLRRTPECDTRRRRLPTHDPRRGAGRGDAPGDRRRGRRSVQCHGLPQLPSAASRRGARTPSRIRRRRR